MIHLASIPALPKPRDGGPLSEPAYNALARREGWLVDVKLDGWRAVYLSDGRVVTRGGNLLDTFAPLPPEIPYVDGEWYERRFIAFDAPIAGPLTRRRRALAALALPIVPTVASYAAIPREAEGIVVKRIDAPYPAGRALTDAWVKLRKPGLWTGAGATRYNPSRSR